MSLRSFALSVPLLLFTSAVPVKIVACVCQPPQPPCEAFWEADAVFVGKVTGITSRPADSSRYAGAEVVRFQVEDSFRGRVSDTVTVYTGGDDCRYDFDVGERYLAYAYKDEEQNLTTNICSRTRPIGRSTSEDFVYIRGFHNRPPGSWIFGTIADGTAEKLAAGVKVIVRGEKTEQVTYTDAEGNYLFVGLNPGRYQVLAETGQPVSWEVEVHDRGCAEVSLPFWYFRRLRLLGEGSER
jgi:hypothetical protein